MAAIRNILLLSILSLTLYLVLVVGSQDEPEDAVGRFIGYIQNDDRQRLLSSFGDNTCNCMPRGGYLAWLCYRSGEPESIAFLLGKKFSTLKMNTKLIPAEIVQGTGSQTDDSKKPPAENAQVAVPIKFDQNYSPYFLPLDMAYGYPMAAEEFDRFCQDPSPDFNNKLNLRLRPTLARGLIEAAGTPMEDGTQPKFSADLLKGLFPPNVERYLRPTDPGPVIVLSEDKSKKNAQTLERQAADFAQDFPRLESATLSLTVVRRGKSQPWHIKKIRLSDPVFKLASGKSLALSTPEL